MIFPIVKGVSESVALGYVASRTVESVLILVGVVSLMSVVSAPLPKKHIPGPVWFVCHPGFFPTTCQAAPIDERLHLRRAGAAGLRTTPSSRAAIAGKGVGQCLFDRCGVHAEGAGDLAAVDDEGFLELVLHLR